MTAPAWLWEQLEPPTGKQTCKTCGLPYKDHSGRYCRICGEAFEHHDVKRKNRSDPVDHLGCIAGQVRMASARRDCDLPLTDLDRQALAAHPNA